jgi:hypothetical protein
MALIRESLEDVVASLGALSAHERATVTLARAVADELDGGQTANAALVKQFRDLLEALNRDADSDDDPIGAVLTRILNSSTA